MLRRAARLVAGIESTCDDSGVALVSAGGRVVREALARQDHEQSGGVMPGLAAEQHRLAVPRLLDEVVGDGVVTCEGGEEMRVSALAVARGPGLDPCLWAGHHAACDAARRLALPVVPVHHLDAHVLMARLAGRVEEDVAHAEFPCLALIVSGGNSMLVVAHDVGDYTVLGKTLDDAVGEAMDKTARLLRIAGGGAGLERAARDGNATRFPLTRPMLRRAGLDLSYSGLKTAVRHLVARHEIDVVGDEQARADVAASFQEAALGHLVHRTRRAVRFCREHDIGLRHVIVSGGVACNSLLRTRLGDLLEEESGGETALVAPPIRYCTDNGVMIAWAAIEHGERYGYDAGIWDGQHALEPRPRWPLAELTRDASRSAHLAAAAAEFK